MQGGGEWAGLGRIQEPGNQELGRRFSSGQQLTPSPLEGQTSGFVQNTAPVLAAAEVGSPGLSSFDWVWEPHGATSLGAVPECALRNSPPFLPPRRDAGVLGLRHSGPWLSSKVRMFIPE